MEENTAERNDEEQQHGQEEQQREEPGEEEEEPELHNSCCCGCLPPWRRRGVSNSNSLNQILPANNPEAPDQEFITFKPGRRIRVVIRRPNDLDLVRDSRRHQRCGSSVHSCGHSTTDAGCGTEEEVLSDDNNSDGGSDDNDDEDYWFENAAPNRLPVIQPPLPPPQHLSRIINKFEPQASTAVQQHQLATSAAAAAANSNNKEDLISPGRLPRKNFIKEDRMNATDDYEDEDVVTSTDIISRDELRSSLRSSPLLRAHNSNNTLDLKLDLSSASDGGQTIVRRNSPVGISPRLRSASPLNVALQRSRSASPVSLQDRRGSLSRTIAAAAAQKTSSSVLPPPASSRSPSPSAEERNLDLSLSSLKKYSSPATSSPGQAVRKSIFHPLSSSLHSPSSPRSANIVSSHEAARASPLPAAPPDVPPAGGTPTLPPRSPDSSRTTAADDSCFPSPEMPHRTVSVEPEPDLDRRPDSSSVPAAIISGSRLGGIANKGFTAEEEEEGENPSEADATDKNSDNNVPEEAKSTEDAADAGYSRKNRTFEGFLQLSQQEENQRKLSMATTDDGGGRRKRRRLPILFFLHGVGGSADIWAAQLGHFVSKAVLRIRIRIRMFLGLLDPDPLFISMDPDPSIIKQKQHFYCFVTSF
jgi:hypothetical protein